MIIQSQPDLVLTEVYVADFGDNYHRLATDPSSDLERGARRIRRRYKNIAEYMNALSIYNEYMEILVAKHGGSQLFGIKNRYDLIEEFVPPKPRMRNTMTNKFILKNRIMLSHMKHTEAQDSVLDFIEDTFHDDRTPIDFEETRMRDRSALRMIKEDSMDISAKKIREMTNIDHLEEYFRTKNVIKHKKEEEVKVTLSDILSGKYTDKIKDTTEEDSVIFYKGNYMSQDTVQDLHVYESLNTIGWNSMKLMKHKNVSKRVTRVISDRERKLSKSQKKRKKDNDFIIKIATDNEYDTFKDYEEAMTDFTASNIFN